MFILGHCLAVSLTQSYDDSALWCYRSSTYMCIFIYLFISQYTVLHIKYHRYYRAEKTTKLWSHQKDTREENTKINYGLDTTGEKEKRTSKKNVDGRSTSSHDNKRFRNRSMEKQRGMAFGFR